MFYEPEFNAFSIGHLTTWMLRPCCAFRSCACITRTSPGAIRSWWKRVLISQKIQRLQRFDLLVKRHKFNFDLMVKIRVGIVFDKKVKFKGHKRFDQKVEIRVGIVFHYTFTIKVMQPTAAEHPARALYVSLCICLFFYISIYLALYSLPLTPKNQ